LGTDNSGWQVAEGDRKQPFVFRIHRHDRTTIYRFCTGICAKQHKNTHFSFTLGQKNKINVKFLFDYNIPPMAKDEYYNNSLKLLVRKG